MPSSPTTDDFTDPSVCVVCRLVVYNYVYAPLLDVDVASRLNNYIKIFSYTTDPMICHAKVDPEKSEPSGPFFVDKNWT